jgi:hypothetical protein
MQRDASANRFTPPSPQPSQAWHGNRISPCERPPRGDEGECRRACERKLFRGRRRLAAGGRRLSLPFLHSLNVHDLPTIHPPQNHPSSHRSETSLRGLNTRTFLWKGWNTRNHWAPTNGVVAASLEGGALVSPPALTPSSSWWALVTILPCHAWIGRGLGGANPIDAIRAISSYQEASTRTAFQNIICTLKAPRSHARTVCFFKTKYSSYTVPFWGGMGRVSS